jgi:Arc/MetJ-type ribon-helix-helix transcriptional regulator
MSRFDFTAPGELFCSRSISMRSRVTYKRFASAAEAVRFAIEELPAEILRSTTLEVAERRLRGDEIRQVYQDPGYPLARKAAA